MKNNDSKSKYLFCFNRLRGLLDFLFYFLLWFGKSFQSLDLFLQFLGEQESGTGYLMVKIASLLF